MTIKIFLYVFIFINIIILSIKLVANIDFTIFKFLTNSVLQNKNNIDNRSEL